MPLMPVTWCDDDLKALADIKLSTKGVEQDPEAVARAVSTVFQTLDQQRFPWVCQNRLPTDGEREIAVISTASLIANQRALTYRRNTLKREQEEMVAEVIRGAGLRQVSTRDIANLSQAPRAGEFCRECTVGGRKADIVIGLWDGRTLLCECKVSNSYTNSVKRLNNDAAVKARTWNQRLGSSNVVPCAILSGLYKLVNLKDAQEAGLFLFWSHDLTRLDTFIRATRG